MQGPSAYHALVSDVSLRWRARAIELEGDDLADQLKGDAWLALIVRESEHPVTKPLHSQLDAQEIREVKAGTMPSYFLLILRRNEPMAPSP